MLVTPSWVASLETNMQFVQNNTYANLQQYVWWRDLVIEKSSKSMKEVLLFQLESAQLHDGGPQGGFKTFDVMRFLQTQAINTYKQSAFELTEAEATDLDSAGVQAAAQWAREITTLGVYQPQRMLAQAILNAGLLSYDGLTFFNATHFTNGYDATQGTFSNLLNGATLGTAAPIGPVASVTLDVAMNNLSRVIAYVNGAYLTPTGYPRNLRVKALIVPPALAFRAMQLTGAKFLPAAAASGGGSQDTTPLISNFGVGVPIVAPELGAAFGGNDNTYYVLFEDVGELGAFVYFEREPYSMQYHDKMTDAELDRADKLQWVYKGRNSLIPFHPFMLAKVTPT